MNPRIQDLAKQAGINIPDDSVYNGHIYRNSLERFAQSIVRECIDIAYREGDNVAYLALHFGVEE